MCALHGFPWQGTLSLSSTFFFCLEFLVVFAPENSTPPIYFPSHSSCFIKRQWIFFYTNQFSTDCKQTNNWPVWMKWLRTRHRENEWPSCQPYVSGILLTGKITLSYSFCIFVSQTIPSYARSHGDAGLFWFLFATFGFLEHYGSCCRYHLCCDRAWGRLLPFSSFSSWKLMKTHLVATSHLFKKEDLEC